MNLDERLQLHLAAQVAGAFGRTHAPEAPRWQHIALRVGDGWESAAADGVSAAVMPDDGTLEVRGPVTADVLLRGHTLQEVVMALNEILLEAGLHEPVAMPPADKRPDHAVSHGGAFTLQRRRGRGDLHAKAATLLENVRAAMADADPVLLWPHHFDVSFARDLGADRAMTVGMSPGDASYAEPYWYVTPWPYPTGDLPPLDSGHWHTQGWTGAVLPVGAPHPERFFAAAQRVMEEVMA